MNKSVFYISLIVLLLLLPCAVSAEKINVVEKHILGNQENVYGGPLFILTSDKHEDYMVRHDTYYSVHVGDTVELTPDKWGFCELPNNNDNWW